MVPDSAPLHLEGQRLDGLPFQRAQLTDHIIKEMGTWFTAGKTVVKGCLDLPQFLQEPFHIAADEVKGGNGKCFARSPTGW